MTVTPGRPVGGSAPPAHSPARLTSAFGTSGAMSLAEHRATYAIPPLPARQPDMRLVELVERAGLRGRGGAGFPTGTKLRSVAERQGPAVVVANGSEGEPASSKDKMVMEHAPHLLLDGVLLAAVAVGASDVVIGVERGARALRSLRTAIDERAAREHMIPVQVVEVPHRYVAGEESALVHLINGGEAKPTLTPPRPYERGVRGRPTLLSNVETFAHLAMITRWGPAWFRELGTADDPGTALVTVTGGVRRPGVFEIPLGTPLTEVVNAAGGTTDGIQAALVGGYYGTWIAGHDALSAHLASGQLRRLGAALGCGAVVVLPDQACGLVETANVLTWMAGETAGQCGPCVHGLAALAGAMTDLARGRANRTTLRQLERWATQIEGRGACRFPDGAVRLLRSALAVFVDDINRHLRQARCSHSGRPARLPIPAERPGWR